MLFALCSFEQFGEQTLLLIFCGPKGNGKTLRTERAMAAFVKGWITMSGPSSAKAGMQGTRLLWLCLCPWHPGAHQCSQLCTLSAHRQLGQQQRQQLRLRRGKRAFYLVPIIVIYRKILR